MISTIREKKYYGRESTTWLISKIILKVSFTKPSIQKMLRRNTQRTKKSFSFCPTVIA